MAEIQHSTSVHALSQTKWGRILCRILALEPPFNSAVCADRRMPSKSQYAGNTGIIAELLSAPFDAVVGPTMNGWTGNGVFKEDILGSDHGT